MSKKKRDGKKAAKKATKKSTRQVPKRKVPSRKAKPATGPEPFSVREPGDAAAPEGPSSQGPPQQREEWGDPIAVGSVGPIDLTIRTPLNNAAIKAATQEQLLLLVFEHKIGKLQKRVGQLERDMDIYNRLSRIEARLGLEDELDED